MGFSLRARKALLGGTLFSGILLALVVSGLRKSPPQSASEETGATTAARGASDPLAVILTPHEGEGAIDKEIRALQAKIKDAPDRLPLLERLGWTLVGKARLSSDPGYYTLAEQAAIAINKHVPEDPSAALLLGHVRHATHRFTEAEQIARSLTARRDFVFDHALLGDALMEQGKLDEAVAAYQRMVDLKPSLQTYSRVAHMRWLKGDLPGALEASRLAASSGSPREAEATAWAYTRFALYQMQSRKVDAAFTSVEIALELAPEYAPALLVRGKLLLSQDKYDEAAAALAKAAEISPLPEYLWTAAEAHRANNNAAAAEQLEQKLTRTGAANDARTFAVFLATRRLHTDDALRLTEEELSARKDIFSYDARAWAEFAAGRTNDARANIDRALAEGTQDARLFYHAGTIAAAAGDHAQALKFLNQAHALEHMLLPSERQSLQQRTAALISAGAQLSSTN